MEQRKKSKGQVKYLRYVKYITFQQENYSQNTTEKRHNFACDNNVIF